MMKGILTLLVMLVAAQPVAVVAAERAIEPIIVDDWANHVPEPNTVAVVDKRLAFSERSRLGNRDRSKIAVARHGSDRVATGRARVRVVFLNRTDYDQQIEVRTHWMDASGFEVEQPSAWHRVFLSPLGQQQYSETSMSLDAANYYVEVREAG